MIITGIAILVGSLVLAGILTVATRKRVKVPLCSCLEFVGDDPHCLVHRSARGVEPK